MKPQHASADTLRAHLLQSMADNSIPVGAQLPPETQLMRQFSLSRSAVRKVLFELAVEGLIERYQGRGSFRTAGNKARSRPTGLAGVWLDCDYGPIFGRLPRGVYDELAREGYHCIIETNLPEAGGTQRLESLVQKRLDGFICVPDSETADSLRPLMDVLDSGVPLVLIDRPIPNRDANIVRTHFELAVEELVDYLVGSGHRRIGFIGTDDRRELADAYQRWIEAGRFAADAAWRIIVPAAPREPYQGSRESEQPPFPDLAPVLEQPASLRPTAFICTEDALAWRAAQLIQEHGLRVPEDVSVTGFEPLLEASPGGEWLTTYAQPAYRIGLQAARLLVQQIKNPTEKPTSILLQGHLLRRGSSGPAAAE